MTATNGKRKNENGFSLIELSLVLVIVGMILSVGVGVMNSLTKTSKISREKANLGAIKNTLVAYALSRGRLPTPNPPRELPYIELSFSPGQKDIWGLPYQYDVTNILTQTDTQNFCVTLYQLTNLYAWSGWANNVRCNNINIPRLGYGLDMVCVTDTTDGNNNGSLASITQGYPIAAYISSMGEDHVRGGKNINTNHEFEMRSNLYDVNVGRDDLSEELTFSDLSSKICNAQNTAIEVEITGEAWLDNTGGCVPATGFSGGPITISMRLGQTLFYGAGCSSTVTFEELAQCDVRRNIYTGTDASCDAGLAGDSFNGKVKLDTSSGAITQ